MNTNKKMAFFILLFGFLFSIVFTYNIQLNHLDNDSFWHIKTGEYIFLNKQIPTMDIFSWYGMENNLRWINHEWLFDLVIYLIYRLGGMPGVVFSASLVAGLLFLLIYRFTLERCSHPALSRVIAFLGVCGLSPFISPRPQVLSYCLLILMALLFEKKKWFWAIPILIIGTNLHGGFYPMYLLVAAYYAWKEKPLLLPLMLLAVMINPYGPEMVTYPFHIQSNADFKYISEWKPTQLGTINNVYYLFSYLILLISVFNKRLRIEDAVFSLLLIIQSFMASRHLVFLFILVFPILSPYIAEKINHLAAGNDGKLNNKVGNTAFVVLCTLLLIFYMNTIREKGFHYHGYPEKAVAYIKQNNIERIGNLYNEGGFLIFHDVKTFIDGRADIFAPLYNNSNLFLDYCQFRSLETDYLKFIDTYKLKNLLIDKKTPIYLVLKNNALFKTIYEDDQFVIFHNGRAH